MKIYYKHTLMLLFLPLLWIGCYDDLPIDEDGLLITERAECYVSRFELLGVDYNTVRAGGKDAVIDTLACTIDIEVKWATDLKNLYPQFTLAQDCKLDPKITGITDFSDLANPKKYTVISGNRNVKKTYTVNIKIQER
ncbi:MAG: hypothetical protein LBU22_00885 [Dysgonamonadaceae bacterium]|nr:hypothetical protein [Dysgonamonadaceae bacterium]